MVGSKPLEVLWNAEQVAKYFGVRKTTVWKWVRCGEVFDPASVVRLGRHFLIPRSEIERVTAVKKEKLHSIMNTHHPLT